MRNLKKIENVSELLKRIKFHLEKPFSSIEVKGEISNISKSVTGHIYFNLSDHSSSLSCAFFKNDYLTACSINPELRKLSKGMNVICRGPISVYTQRGTFQLIVKSIQIEGEGNLKKQFEELKSKLASEGLFDLSLKKKLKTLPKKIAVITALHGAALKDFLNVFNRRSKLTDIMIVPTLVQGERAGKAIQDSLIKTIRYNLKQDIENKIDVIVLTRGGGSDEDLWCFNDEQLIWEIFNCPIPVVSAVGHQRDFTLCDFVSDVRCETPSSAAELLSQDGMELNVKLNNIKKHLENSCNNILYQYKNKLHSYKPDQLFYKLNEKIKFLDNKLEKLNVTKKSDMIFSLNEKKVHLDNLISNIEHTVNSKVDNYKNKLNLSHGILLALNPNSVLKRGYSLSVDKNGKVISSANKFDNLKDNEVILRYHDGERNVSKI